MTEYAEIEERRQDIAAQSVPETKEVDKADEVNKEDVKHFVDNLLTRVYTTFDNDIKGVNSILKDIAKKYKTTDKEFVGFLEYVLRKVQEKDGAGWLTKRGAFEKLFVEWRWDDKFQRIIYQYDKDDNIASSSKRYYNYLSGHNQWYLSILNSFEIDRESWGAKTYEEMADNLQRATEELFQIKKSRENSIASWLDSRIRLAKRSLSIDGWNEKNEFLREEQEAEMKKYEYLKSWVEWRRKSTNEVLIWWMSPYDAYILEEGRITSIMLHLFPLADNQSGLDKLLDEDFVKWSSERKDLLRSDDRYFNRTNLAYLSLLEQVSRWKWSSEIDKAFYEAIKKEKVAFSKADIILVLDKIYWKFSYSEVLWELIMTWDWKNREVLEKIQLFSWIFANLEHLFKIEYNWKWNAATYEFLSMLRNDEKFRSGLNSAEYIAKIEQLLASHSEFKWHVEKEWFEKHYDTYSSVVQHKKSYWENPVGYRRSQERWHRDFVWVSREKSAYPTISSDTQIERSFISNSANQSSNLNWEIAKWLDMSWKTLEQQKDVEERLMHLIPKDKIYGVVNELLSNPDIRRNFVEKLNMPEDLLDDEMLFDRILNYETWDQQFETIKERFFWNLWENKWDIIINFAGELSDFLKEQIGVSALNVRKDFLENIFWFSISPVELPWQKDDVFYFKDQYHPETLYEYRPKTWEIFAQESISLKDWEIFFNWGQTDQKRLIYTLKKYSEYLDWVDVFWVLPMWWDRPDSFESLQDEISRNIQRYMHVDVWFTEIEWIHERNDSERMKNEIVNKAREILWITQDQLTESQDGPYYELLLAVINTVQNISRDSLAEVRFFFDQFSEIIYSINNWLSINESSLNNPLLKFIVEKTKNLENRGNNLILDAKTKKNWKEKDLAFWSILRELMYTDVDWKEKLNVSSIVILNGASEWSVIHERFMQGIRDRYNQLCNPLTELRNQELSSLEEWRNNAVQWVIRETWSEVADLWHFVRADQKLDREMDKAFELEFDVSVKIPDNPQNDIA